LELLVTKGKPAADDHLEDEMVRAAREANPDAEIKLPLWGHINPLRLSEPASLL